MIFLFNWVIFRFKFQVFPRCIELVEWNLESNFGRNFSCGNAGAGNGREMAVVSVFVHIKIFSVFLFYFRVW